MRQALLLAFCIFCTMHSASAQIQKILHQAFSLEGINHISLNLEGEYEIDKWAGNSILVETQIEIYDASPSILKHMLAQGRYMLDAQDDSQRLALQTKAFRKQPILKNGIRCYENVKLRLLIPEEFNVIDQQTLERIIDVGTTTTSTDKEK